MPTTLKDKLSALPPKEQRAYISNVWKTFAGTEQFEALQLLLTDLNTGGEQAVLNPSCPDHTRAFSAGILATVKSVRDYAKIAIDYDPETDTDDEPVNPPDEPEVPAEDPIY